MATTTNYGWDTPDDTDLVKDGAAAIRTLGSSVDTTTKALNPSTTLGDIEYRSATANTNTRLGIGSTGDVLTVAGGVPSWAAPAGGGSDVWSLIATGSPSGSTSSLSISVSGYKKIMIIGRQIPATTANSVYFRLNANSLNYSTTRNILYRNSSSQFTSNYMDRLTSGSELLAMDNVSNSNSNNAIYNIRVDNLNVAGFKPFDSIAWYLDNGGTEQFRIEKGIWANTATVTTLDIIAGSGNLSSAGLYNIYGAAA